MGSTLAGVWGAIFWEGYETISGHRHLYNCRGKGQGILFSVTFNLPHPWYKCSNDWGWVYFSFNFPKIIDMGQRLNSLYETGSQNTSVVTRLMWLPPIFGPSLVAKCSIIWNHWQHDWEWIRHFPGQLFLALFDRMSCWGVHWGLDALRTDVLQLAMRRPIPYLQAHYKHRKTSL